MQKRTLLFMTSALMVSVLAGCGKADNRTQVRFWTGFGGAVNSVLEPMLKDFQEENPDIKVIYETQGGYDGLKQAIELSISQQAYPNMANGYPDHFAKYISSNIQLSLDSYINDPEYGVDIDDFYPDYLRENQNLVNDPSNPDKKITMGIPFNKSTEIMVANETFFKVLNDIDPTVKVPTTWDEVDTIGTRIREIVKAQGFYGNIVVKNSDGSYQGVTTVSEGQEVMFDFRKATEATFIPFNWDSEDNFFITLVRQFGGVYTEIGKDINEGFVRFNSPEVVSALQLIKDLAAKRLVGIPMSYGESLYASKPFKEVRTVLTISSTAGIQENIPDTMEYPFEVGVHPIVYKDANRKYVISQGTNLTIFNRRNPEQQMAAWRLIKYLTTDRNAEFARKTAYFPVTKSAQESEEYQNFLNGDTSGYTPKEKSVFDTAKVNNDYYMVQENNWIKFVDPAFVGSSQIRTEVSYIIGKVIIDGLTPQKAIDEAYSRLGNYIQK